MSVLRWQLPYADVDICQSASPRVRRWRRLGPRPAQAQWLLCWNGRCNRRWRRRRASTVTRRPVGRASGCCCWVSASPSAHPRPMLLAAHVHQRYLRSTRDVPRDHCHVATARAGCQLSAFPGKAKLQMQSLHVFAWGASMPASELCERRLE